MTARKVFLVLLTAGVVGTAAWLVFFSPVLGVRTVEIVGNVTLAPDVVRKAAAVPDLHPLATVDLAQVEDRVRGIRQVASAKVDRVWPATLRIEVVEREPVAQIPAGDKIAVIDKTGAVIELRDVAPPMLPVLKVASPAVGDPATMAALDVVRGLPASISGRVRQVSATTGEDVTLGLSDGRTVVWGGTDRPEAKARILRSLLKRKAEVYDVSSPDVVTLK
ncbi:MULTISPECIES: cell division protein FtsQ/DivIB [Nonomuraea]|uniref:Cell division protein FtsQ/DivIB n=2 Tax=Nonomuraea TaxID=83681 RepID=A0ABW1BTX5_9ACTN|nr:MULTISPECIES: FtsQ-type POTRA domain-containing protein [Nonomuraea]MDA0645356.1 FtsQ-type POTRA domain-containing protein [Nonomuraea ferruginea]TXK41873.1 FtsQ-type POTRA domain-containing protein [Nonomuraea sp. C10]